MLVLWSVRYGYLLLPIYGQHNQPQSTQVYLDIRLLIDAVIDGNDDDAADDIGRCQPTSQPALLYGQNVM